MGLHSAEEMEEDEKIANVISQMIDDVDKDWSKTDVLISCRSKDGNVSLIRRRQYFNRQRSKMSNIRR